MKYQQLVFKKNEKGSRMKNKKKKKKKEKQLVMIQKDGASSKKKISNKRDRMKIRNKITTNDLERE